MKITEEELNSIIADASRQGARAAIKEARRQKLYRDGMDSFQKTEYILRNYKEFKNAIREREEKISDINVYGIKHKSKSITSYPGGTRSYVQDDTEKAESQIEVLEKDNMVTKRLVSEIEDALESIKSDPYSEVISKYYFEGKKYEVIAGELGVSVASVSTAKRKLVEKIKIRIFTDSVVREILGVS